MICGITSMAITQPRNRLNGFNILNVPNLLRCMDYRANAPYGPQNSLVIVGDPAANGELVYMVADQQLVANPLLTGLRDQASNGGEQPVMQSNGLQWLLPFQDLTIGNTPVQTGLTTWTGYFWGTLEDEATWIAAGHVSDLGLVGVDGNAVQLSDDSGNLIAGDATVTPGQILVRVSYNATTGAYRIQATGTATNTGNIGAGLTFSLNLVGRSIGWGFDNSSINNRHLGQIIVARIIVPDSAEDMNIRLRSIIPAGYAL